ncbi:MAG: glycosyltransferase [Chloroflexota bacterium]
MKITIMTVGTRGDVQPYVALAKGLQTAGHQVKVATDSKFENFVRGSGIEFVPVRADYYSLMDTPEGHALKSGNPIRIMQNMKSTVFPLMRKLMDDAWVAVQGAEAIIFHPKVLVVPHIAEKLGIPCIMAATVPAMTPTSAFPAPGVVSRDLGGWLNKKTYAALGLATASFNGMIKSWRQEVVGLPAESKVVKGFTMYGRPIPILYCYSQYVVPVPADWDNSAHVTGYWFLDEKHDWQPSPELIMFLASGAPPVYVGFGSMVAEDAQKMTQTVIDALQKSGQRGVIATGWGGLRDSDLPSTIFKLQEAPHEWLFPRMAAVVHHGGAGTVAAGLRAGKPTVVCPFIADQPFWGNRVADLGVGPAPIPQKKLTVDNLAAAIHSAATDTGMRDRAADLGAKLRAEDGVGNAVQMIERLLNMRTAEPKAVEMA